jgi:predicted DsbA family dithiol-disulfide isomerase
MFFRVLAPLACVFVFTLGCPEKGPGSPDSKAATSEEDVIVARVGDETVTASELDAWIKDDLFARQTSGGNPAKVYDLRAQSLERMIMERIVAAEAARRNLTDEEFIDAEITALGEVTDEEVAQFYQERIDQMGEQPFDQVAPRIRDYLTRFRAQTVAEKLFGEAGVDLLLERPRVEVSAIGPSRGPANAPVTIVEFSDFECPFCSRALPAIEEVMERYPDDVRLVYRHMPLDRIHKRARVAAEASHCAHDQGQFWAYHDLIFANKNALGDEDLKRFAEELNLDVAAWEECMAEGKFADAIEADVEAARSIGITGTPAFVINGVMLSGAKPVEDFVTVIEAELKPPETTPEEDAG